MRRPGIGLDAFEKSSEEETIILRRRVPLESGNGRRPGQFTQVPLDYPETAETQRLRHEMQRINEALAQSHAFITFVDRPPNVDPNRMRLVRIFNVDDDAPRYDRGGRLYGINGGAWWQSIKKEDRSRILIDGSIADLDYSSMFIRLAYLRAGLEPPDGDLYAGIVVDPDGRHRDGVKQVVNAMLFRDKPLDRLPRDTARLLPAGCTGGSIRVAILRRHPKLDGIFETGIGMSLMFTESQIMVALLLRLIGQGIIALPMHDGIMVARRDKDAAKSAMQDVAESVVGFRLPVKVTDYGRPR